MKKSLLAMAVVIAAAGTLAADTVSPQLLLDLDANVGARTAPADQSGHGIGGGTAGLEYQPIQNLGLDVDYGYLAVGKTTQNRDNDIDIALRGISESWGPVSVWLKGGIGYNASQSSTDGHYLAFINPGVRYVILPRLAGDAGVEYFVSTPEKNFTQAAIFTVGLTIPLDGDFASQDAPAAAAAPAAAPAAVAPAKSGM